MKPLDITVRLAAAFCLLAAVLVGVGWQGISHLRQLNAQMQSIIRDRWEEQLLSHQAYRLSSENGQLNWLTFLMDDPDKIQQSLVQRDANTRRITELMNAIEPRLHTGTEKQLFSVVQATRVPYVESYQRALSLLLTEHKRDEAREMMVDIVRPRLAAYHHAWGVFNQFQADEINQAMQQSKTEFAVGQRNFLFVLTAAALIIGAIAIFTVVRIGQDTTLSLRAKQSLQQARDEVEMRVVERTAELATANELLKAEIAERKRAEESLRLLGSAVQQSKESIVITDAEPDLPGPKILFVNPAFTAMTGYTAEEAIGKTPRMLQGPLTDKTVLRRLRQNLERGEAFAGEAINYRKDGAQFILEWQVAPIRDASGKITHFVAIQRDITARKETENTLRESNGKFRQLVDNITDAFWIRSPDLSELHYVSPAFERIWGRSVASLYAQPLSWPDFILPEDRERVVSAFAALQGDTRSLDIEYRILRPDGEVRWVRVRGFQVRDAADKLIRHIGIVTDITKIKQTEASLMETSGLLLALLENTNDLIYFKDRESRFVQFSREMLNRFHLTRPDELRGRTDFDFFSEEHARPAFEAEQEIIRTSKAALNLEEKETHLDGRVTWALTSKMPRRDEAGSVIGTMGISRDITERKRVETALRESEKRLSSLIENARDAIFTIAADGTFTSLNPAVAAVCGITRAEWIGKPFAPLLHPDDLPLAREMFHFVLKGGQAPVHELRGHPGLSRPVLMEMTLTAQKDEAGKTIGVLGIGRDITDRKRLEARLFQSQKLETVGKLAGGIAHEFNSILTAIIGQSELLLEDLPAGGSLAKSVGEISKAAMRAAALTRQLLAYGRKQMLHPEALDLNGILAGMDSMLRHLMAGDAVDVKIVSTVGLRLVKADAGQIEQVIINLAMNAHDAMPNGGKLTLETANVSFDQDSVGRYPELKPGNYVMLAISDTGRGMSETVKMRAFEPFFTTKDVGQGTGLGLSTCYGIIKQSGGHIGVYSEPGQGTTFKIYLPQVEERTKLPVQPLDAPDLPRGTETVLLVEDDPALREMAATLLRRLGYTVLAAANGVEALSLCHERETGRIDLLFTDVVMPHMSGKELADRMRALYPHTRVLFTSAYTETAIVHQGVMDQGVALLQKPYSPSTLAQRLRAVLDQRPMN